ncbi:MAG: hypothetical protein EAY66_09435 [Sphingobacteriales bacterium]|jgi:hypothetical protein|nr:MAG: hypothetical protein EAY66_09435 [Sphingobacteriales bacterium]
MEDYKQDFESISGQLKDYIALQVEITKLKATETGVRIASSFVAYFLLAVFVVLLLLSGFLALGFYLAVVTGSNAAGFGWLAAILLLIVLILFLIKDKMIIKPLENKFIINIFKNW